MKFAHVVLPFSNSGPDSSALGLREGVVDLLSPMLTGEGGPMAVDSRTAISAFRRVSGGRDATAAIARDVAREVGAGKALFGTLVLASGRLTLTANLVSAGRGVLQPLTSVTGSPDSLPAMLDGRLIDVRPGRARPRRRHDEGAPAATRVYEDVPVGIGGTGIPGQWTGKR